MSEIAAAFVGLPFYRAFAVIRVEAALQHEVPSAQITLSRQEAVLQPLEQFNMQCRTGNLDPVSDYANFCDKVDTHVLDLIRELAPKYWFIENPRGGITGGYEEVPKAPQGRGEPKGLPIC